MSSQVSLASHRHLAIIARFRTGSRPADPRRLRLPTHQFFVSTDPIVLGDNLSEIWSFACCQWSLWLIIGIENVTEWNQDRCRQSNVILVDEKKNGKSHQFVLYFHETDSFVFIVQDHMKWAKFLVPVMVFTESGLFIHVIYSTDLYCLLRRSDKE